VDERIQFALNCGAAHRLSKKGLSGRSFWDFSLKTVPVLGIVVALIGWLLSSCVPSQPALESKPVSQAAARSNVQPALTMADRIRFQDRLSELALPMDHPQTNQPVKVLSMADRIHFQDRVLDLALAKDDVQVNQPVGTFTMADRIRFQDRMMDLALSNAGNQVGQPAGALSMADRIKFHDGLAK
jgi:hypothetical protein